MKTPQKDVQQILDWASEASKGHYPIGAVAHRAIECIIDNCDPALLSEIPPEVATWIREMIEVYKTEGRVLIGSSVGEADQTELTRQLVRVLEGNERAT